ncbi:MAG: hypothetical protein IT372_24850 [Polyangiaceae bacterium]|nr:hypothetical protein [Polyangiaceae bacterium]
MKDLGDYIALMIGILMLVGQLLGKLAEARRNAPAPAPEPRPRARPPAVKPPGGSVARPPAPGRAPSPAAMARAAAAAKAAQEASRRARERLDKLERKVADFAAELRLERANRRFGEALAGYASREIAFARDTLLRTGDVQTAGAAVDRVKVVLAEIRTLARQRRDPELLPELGDADAFAAACYAPVIAFARAEGLPLRTAHPATQLADFDLAIWTGFIPTSIAPIFLPPDFFSTPLRWPALAHEIGHDFLASIEGLEPALRRELGLPSAEYGGRPLPFGAGGLDASDLRRVLGAWFEEIFCDVFGTLMCGPAYVVTMIELFAATGDPREILVVSPDETGTRYDCHPPPRVRVQVGCAVLERAGFVTDAAELRAAWLARHREDEYDLDRLLFPIGRTFAALPFSIFDEMAREVVERLYAGPLRALSGFGLQDVSGLDYGPHEHMEAQRARDALLARRVPAVRDPRAILSGAVLAARARPDLEAQILANARAAIPALGTGEVRPDAFNPAGATGAGAAEVSREAVIEALVLREILAPPRALRGRRRHAGL